MIRRFGSSKRANQRYRLRTGAYAILPRDGKLLLTYQGGQFNEAQLPGGGIEPGETTLAALFREVFEETGWTIARPRKLGAFRRFTYMPEYELWAEKLCHIYLAWPARMISLPPEKDHSPVWMSPDRAKVLLANDGDRDFVARYV